MSAYKWKLGQRYKVETVSLTALIAIHSEAGAAEAGYTDPLEWYLNSGHKALRLMSVSVIWAETHIGADTRPIHEQRFYIVWERTDRE